MALTFYVDNVGGGSGYGGSSEGSPKASGTGASTSGTSATIDLSADLPDLSTVSIGDTIRVNGRTDGIHNTDIFGITAVDDTLDTVDVTPVPGSTTSGVTWAIGGAFNTIDRSMDVSSVGDKTWIKASASYNETVTMDFAGPLVFEGYTSVTGDGGHITIDGQNTRTNGIVDGTASTNIFYVFKNIDIINCSGNGVEIIHNYITWKNCKFNTNALNGYHHNSVTAALSSFETCEFNDNGIYGFNGGATRDRAAFIGCDFYRNGIGGFRGAVAVFAYSTFFDNPVYQINYSRGDIMVVINCTLDGKDKDSIGINFGVNNDIVATLVNTVIVGCATAFTVPSGIGEQMTSRSNCLFDNTTNYASGAFTLENEILTNPMFNNRSIQDYRLNTGSPCIGAGYDGASLSGYPGGCDIGAYQSI